MSARAEITHTLKDWQAKAIAEALPTGWSWDEAKSRTTGVPDVDRRYDRELRHVDGHGLHLDWFTDGYRSDAPIRIKISGCWPRDARNNLHYPAGDSPSITVLASKNPEAIARDIVVRFLPAYLPQWAKYWERCESANEHERQTQITISMILLAADGHKGAHSVDTVFLKHNEIYSCTAQGRSVRFEAFNVPRELAIKILQICHKPAQPEPEPERCGDVLEDADHVSCREPAGHEGAHRSGQRRWS